MVAGIAAAAISNPADTVISELKVCATGIWAGLFSGDNILAIHRVASIRRAPKLFFSIF